MAGLYWLASYPKSGNTWVRIFLHNLRKPGEGPANINQLHDDAIASGRGWLDDLLAFDTADLTLDELDRMRPACYEWASREATGDEYHKVHDANIAADGESMFTMASSRGVVYILRNPLDVAPSAAHHWGLSLDETIERLCRPSFTILQSRERQTSQAPQRLLDWSGHVLSWVDAAPLNSCIVRYEDMLANGLSEFTRIAQFLGLPGDEASVRLAVERSSFEQLARQEAEKGFKERSSKAERFFRQGVAGGWRHALTPDQVDRVVQAHGPVMRRFGYLDVDGRPV